MRTLNGAQVALCFVWANGTHAWVADEPARWIDATAKTGDLLFQYLMQEIATDEGCDSKREAIRRLESLGQDIIQAAQSL